MLNEAKVNVTSGMTPEEAVANVLSSKGQGRVEKESFSLPRKQ